jgi:hypothetical protein
MSKPQDGTQAEYNKNDSLNPAVKYDDSQVAP